MAIRPARKNDAMHVAALMDIAGHGIEAEFWAQNRDAEGSVLAAARARVLGDESLPYHISRAHLLEVDGDVAAALIGGLVPPDAEVPAGFPSYFAPLLELEAHATGHWAVIGLAVYPEYRGRGLGSVLLRHAEDCALEAAAVGLSLVVEDSNAGALALYRRHGFVLREQRRWLPYAERRGPENWLLLTRGL